MTYSLTFCNPIMTPVSNLPNFSGDPCIYCVLAEDSAHTRPPIYIGETDCLKTRMGQHFGNQDEIDEWEDAAKQINQNYHYLYVSYACLPSERDRYCVEPVMVYELQPICNSDYKCGVPDNRPATEVYMTGPINILNNTLRHYPDS